MKSLGLAITMVEVPGCVMSAVNNSLRHKGYAHNKQFKQTVNAWHFQLGLASVIKVLNLSVLVAFPAT